MRFGKQRATLALLFLLLPFVTALAFLQTPFVSDFVLQFGLRIARFKTGLKIDAKSWSVRPITFSAALENISLEFEKTRLSVPELRIQMSPLSLLIGNIQVRRIQLNEPFLEGRLPRTLLESSNSKNESSHIKDLPKYLGESLAKLTEAARKRNLGFERVEVKGLHSEIEGYGLDSADVELENLEGGQARLEWYVHGLKISSQLADVEMAQGNLALLKNAQREFYMVLPLFQFKPATHSENLIDLNGRWPGEFRASAQFDLAELYPWLKASPALGSMGLKHAKGKLEFEGNFTLTKSNLEKITGELKGQKLEIDEYRIRSLLAKAHGNGNEVEVDSLELTVDVGPGDSAKWRNTIRAQNLKIESNRVLGTLSFDEVGLCSVLTATDVKDCYVSMPINGSLAIDGTFKPFLLKAKPVFNIAGMMVGSGPLKSRESKEDELLAALPLVLSGDVDIGAKDIVFSKMSLDWAESNRITAEGRVQYSPSVVDLLVESRNSHLEKMFQKFLDLSPQGTSNISAKIFYSSAIPVEVGQTRILGRVTIEGVGVESQNFGTIVGPINYASRTLRLGPLRLTNGGGKATLDGTLVQTPKGSFLNIGAVADRLELSGISPESKTDIFRGFVTGTATLRGFTNPKNPEALAGPIDMKLDTFQAFGVPFQKGSIKARYHNRILDLNQVVGTKDKSTVRLKGSLNPDGGTELLFSSDDFKVKDLALSPNLEILQSGLIRIDGFWRPAQGWGLNGQLSQLRIAGADLPNGPVKLSGNDREFKASAKLGEAIDFDYLALSKGARSEPSSLRVNLRDVGLYGAFAYLKGWTSSAPVLARGSIEVDWTPTRGAIKLKNLDIKGPEGQEGAVVPLLKSEGEKELAWNDRILLKNSLSLSGPFALDLSSSENSRNMSFKTKMPLAFLDLVVPNLRFIEGDLEMSGEFPLPPDVATMRGLGSVSRGTLFIRGIGQPIQNTNAKLGISRQQLTISSCKGNLGGGDVSLEGVYKIDLEKPGANLQIGLNRAHVVVADDVPADVTGDLTLKGEQTPYLLAGRVQVSNAVYGKEFKSEPVIVPPNVKPILNFGLDVELGSNVQVRNSLATLFASGRLAVRGNDLLPDIAGKVQLISGSLHPTEETEFKLLQGIVTFPGGVAPAILNIQANTVIKNNGIDYKIDLRVQGPSTTVTPEFTSEPALSNADIINLLAFGMLRTNGDTDLSGDVNSAARIEALQVLFGKAVGQSLRKSTGFNVRIKSAQRNRAAQGTASSEFVPKVLIVKKLSDRMTVTIGHELDLAAPTENAQVDYKLLNNMNLTGVWEGSFAGERSRESSVGLDLRLRFEVK